MPIKLKHPTFPKVSDDMKRRSTLLANELETWPEVRLSNMFGMTSVYRGKAIFALLPDKRGLEFPNAIALRNLPGTKPKHTWQSFLIEDDNDLSAALQQLDEAYRKAKITSGRP
jgi:hypothetical protein